MRGASSAEFLSGFRKDDKLINAITDSELRLDPGSKEVNMCQAIRDMRQESYDQGASDSRRKVLVDLARDGVITTEVAAERLGMSIEEARELIAS